MLFASIFLSLDFREVLTLDLYHEVTFAKTSKPLQPLILYFSHYSDWFSKWVAGVSCGCRCLKSRWADVYPTEMPLQISLE